MDHRVTCPCCGHRTLPETAAYEVCPVCLWEDDGVSTNDPFMSGEGPNGISLIEGQALYAKFGRAGPDAPPRFVARPPRADEPLDPDWAPHATVLPPGLAADLVATGICDRRRWSVSHDGLTLTLTDHANPDAHRSITVTTGPADITINAGLGTRLRLDRTDEELVTQVGGILQSVFDGNFRETVRINGNDVPRTTQWVIGHAPTALSGASGPRPGKTHVIQHQPWTQTGAP